MCAIFLFSLAHTNAPRTHTCGATHTPYTHSQRAAVNVRARSHFFHSCVIVRAKRLFRRYFVFFYSPLTHSPSLGVWNVNLLLNCDCIRMCVRVQESV